ncbi:MAG: M16 family metallopeptidase [Nitrospinota bacterium]
MKQTYQDNKLENGLRVITAPADSSRSLSVMIMANAGSRFEEKKSSGLSHFMEHMFFKGAKRYPNTMAVAGAIDSIGGVFNAFTSEDKVAYYVKLSATKKEVAFDLLSDMIFNSKFESEEIEREKGVIIEEIRMYNDDPMSKVQQDFKQNFFGDQPLGWDIAGPESNINAFQRVDFLNYVEKFYHPSNLLLAVAGNINPQESMELASKYFNQKGADGAQTYSPLPFKLLDQPASSLTTRDIEQAHFVLGLEAVAIDHQDEMGLKVINNILGQTMSSRLFYQVRERRGLAYYIGSSLPLYSDTGLIKISAGVNVDKVGDALSCVADEILKMEADGITEDELHKGKENIKGRLDLSLEDSMSQATLYATAAIMRKKIKTADDIVNEIDALRLEDLNRIAKKYFKLANTKMTILGPFEDIEPFERSLKEKAS